MKKTLIMRGGIILSIICGCFLFWQNAVADGGFNNKYNEDILVTPPALLEVIDNPEDYKKPYINGSVLSEIKKVKIFIDKVLVDEFETTKNDFTYQSKWSLKLGPHFVYAIGFDKLGRTSNISNVINFNIKKIDPHAPQISAIKIEAEEDGINSMEAGEEVSEKKIKHNEDSKKVFSIKKEPLLFLFIIAVLLVWFWNENKKN